MFMSTKFTSKKAAMLIVLTSCLLPVLPNADNNAWDRVGDKGVSVQAGPQKKRILFRSVF